MTIPSPVFVGYFPKIVHKKSDPKYEKCELWQTNKILEEICSVSSCISEGPKGWIDKWTHNDLGFYDTEEAALNVIPDNREKYDLFAYKLYPIRLADGQVIDYKVDSIAIECLDAYDAIGFDIVSRSAGASFECSPLSCNGAHKIYSVNRFCLVNGLDDAFRCWKEISEEVAGIASIKRPDGINEYNGKWEEGPYSLIQVYRRKR